MNQPPGYRTIFKIISIDMFLTVRSTFALHHILVIVYGNTVFQGP